MAKFRKNNIQSLVGEAPRFDFGGSYGPNLRLGAVLGPASDWEDLQLGYASAEGDPAVRAAVAKKHGVDADDVVLTVGSAHALFLAAFMICNRGDQVVAVSPLFPPTLATLEAVGADIRIHRLEFDDGYRLDPKALAELLSPQTRLVSLASPQNPSGITIPEHTLRELVGYMGERCPAAILIVDETYREAGFGDSIAPSAALLSDKIVVTASLSKCHGAPGLRLGWAVTRDPALRAAFVDAKFNTVISCSPVDEAIARRILDQNDKIVAENRQVVLQALDKTQAWVEANAAEVEWIRPDAGALCCVRLKPSVYCDAQVQGFYEAAARAGVRVSNGSWFGEPSRIFRLGFGHLPQAELDEGFLALTRALQDARATP